VNHRRGMLSCHVLFVGLLSVTAAVQAHGQRRPELYEAFLVPLHGTLPSAAGDWRAEVWIRNDGDAPADVFPIGFHLLAPCRGCDISVTPYPSVRPRTTVYHSGDVLLPGAPREPYRLLQDNETPGAFLWIEHDSISSMTLSAILSSPGGQRVNLPIVAAGAFRQGRISIPAVAVEPGKRFALRLFGGPEVPDGAAIRLSTWVINPAVPPIPIDPPLPVETLLGSQVLQMRGDFYEGLGFCLIGDCTLPDVPFKPVYAQLFTLPGLSPELAGRRIRVEFEALDAGVRYFAMLSVTDNNDQTVMIYTP
jgi:hypothetical protein